MRKRIIESRPGRLLHSLARPLLRKVTYTIRSGLGKGLVRKGGFSFLPWWTPPEAAFLTGLDFSGKTVFDVGGYEGVFTIFFARAVGPRGRVVTFEPNPDNSLRIAENVLLNGFGNVDLRPIALAQEPGRVTLVVPRSQPARGSIASNYQAALRRQYATRTIAVEVDSLDRQLASCRLPPPDFVKIDVEAAELAVLMGMQNLLRLLAPTLFIELHSGVDPTSVVQLLFHHGYSIRHIESNTAVTLDAARTACPGHIYCCRTLARS